MPIVVGIDFFPCSKSALAQAARLASFQGSSLYVFHAVERLVTENLADTQPGSSEKLRRGVIDDAKRRLHQALSELGIQGPENTQVEVAIGSPVRELLRVTQAVSAELLVLGISGSFGSGPTFGATVGKCMKKASTSVFAVREQHTGPFRQVVVCVDFSESSKTAVKYGVQIAKLYGSQLYLLHVFCGPWNRLHYRAPTPEANPDFKKQYLDALQGRLEALLTPFKGELGGSSPQCELYEGDSGPGGIIEFAKTKAADLVILGEGKRNLRSLIFGSTSENIVRAVPCSLLLAKPR